MRKAERDLQMAQLGAADPDPPKDEVCFHCQQLSEKYLKALLQESGSVIHRTHDLEALFTQLLPLFPSLKPLKRGLVFLSDFAVETRYPGKNVRMSQMEAALRWADRVRQECRSLLGIKTPGKRTP